MHHVINLRQLKFRNTREIKREIHNLSTTLNSLEFIHSEGFDLWNFLPCIPPSVSKLTFTVMDYFGGTPIFFNRPEDEMSSPLTDEDAEKISKTLESIPAHIHQVSISWDYSICENQLSASWTYRGRTNEEFSRILHHLPPSVRSLYLAGDVPYTLTHPTLHSGDIYRCLPLHLKEISIPLQYLKSLSKEDVVTLAPTLPFVQKIQGVRVDHDGYEITTHPTIHALQQQVHDYYNQRIMLTYQTLIELGLAADNAYLVIAKEIERSEESIRCFIERNKKKNSEYTSKKRVRVSSSFFDHEPSTEHQPTTSTSTTSSASRRGEREREREHQSVLQYMRSGA